jgi:hypothetical protein
MHKYILIVIVLIIIIMISAKNENFEQFKANKYKYNYNDSEFENPWMKTKEIENLNNKRIKKYGIFDEPIYNGYYGLNHNLCSSSCCSMQYPTPFLITSNRFSPKNTEKYVSSNYTCRNGYQDTGCLCMTKNQKRILETRGNNSTQIHL